MVIFPTHSQALIPLFYVKNHRSNVDKLINSFIILCFWIRLIRIFYIFYKKFNPLHGKLDKLPPPICQNIPFDDEKFVAEMRRTQHSLTSQNSTSQKHWGAFRLTDSGTDYHRSNVKKLGSKECWKSWSAYPRLIHN